jgi:hypothetical protein
MLQWWIGRCARDGDQKPESFGLIMRGNAA